MSFLPSFLHSKQAHTKRKSLFFTSSITFVVGVYEMENIRIERRGAARSDSELESSESTTVSH